MSPLPLLNSSSRTNAQVPSNAAVIDKQNNPLDQSANHAPETKVGSSFLSNLFSATTTGPITLTNHTHDNNHNLTTTIATSHLAASLDISTSTTMSSGSSVDTLGFLDSSHPIAAGNPTTLANQTDHFHQPSVTSNTFDWSEISMPKVNSVMDLFSLSCSLAVIFGGLVPYIPQYIKIKKSMSSDGFSTYGKVLRTL